MKREDFPALYKKSKNEKVIEFWNVSTYENGDNTCTVEEIYGNGFIPVYSMHLLGDFNSALNFSNKLWKEKTNEGWYFSSKEAVEDPVKKCKPTIFPIYKGETINFPVTIQSVPLGVRCLIKNIDGANVLFTDINGKRIEGLEYYSTIIMEFLDMSKPSDILDCVVWADDFDLKEVEIALKTFNTVFDARLRVTVLDVPSHVSPSIMKRMSSNILLNAGYRFCTPTVFTNVNKEKDLTYNLLSIEGNFYQGLLIRPAVNKYAFGETMKDSFLMKALRTIRLVVNEFIMQDDKVVYGNIKFRHSEHILARVGGGLERYSAETLNEYKNRTFTCTYTGRDSDNLLQNVVITRLGS